MDENCKASAKPYAFPWSKPKVPAELRIASGTLGKNVDKVEIVNVRLGFGKTSIEIELSRTEAKKISDGILSMLGLE